MNLEDQSGAVATATVKGIMKNIKACSGMIGYCYKESYLDLHCSNFRKTVKKQHCINKLNTSLEKTDSNIGTSYAAQSKVRGKRFF